MTKDSPPGEPGVLIRPVGTHELEALHELDIAVFGRWAYPFFALRQLFDAHRPYWLIAEGPGGHMRGYTLAVRCSDPDPGGPSAWLFGLGVREEYRRMGCGRMLTAAVLDLLSDRQVRIAKLTVEPDNVSAIALYEEFGFVTTGYGKDYFGCGDDRLLMEANLPSAPQAPARVTENYHQ